ncbi:MAG TPA: anthrone oxygenase family protein [Woeseiaceae bacterium]|nr:anthrone oxygenase family protein [Woeseiaceae bacterium]
MRVSLQLFSIVLVTVALTPPLAHALELPGKRRLTQDVYVTVQKMYYPGFTLAGIAEPVAILSTLLLLLVTPFDTTPFWSTLFALLCLAGMHTIYWRVTHPLNRAWLEGERLSKSGQRFFAAGQGSKHAAPGDGADWTALRDRWERSHVNRAILAALALVALLIALSPIETK